jgi:hypothetical protein
MAKTNSAFLLCLALCAAPARGQTPSAAGAPRHVATDAAVSSIVLVKASDAVAVVRVGAGALEKLRAGDLVAKTKAVVKEISSQRLVLEETFVEKNGKPNRALIVIKEGERGGTRYLQRADEPPLTGTKPLIVMPATPDPAKPAPKKRPQM